MPAMPSARVAPWESALGDVDLADATLADLRSTVLARRHRGQLFMRTLQDAVDPHQRLTRRQAEEAL